MLGWMASIAAAPEPAGGKTLDQVVPASAVRSKCTRHLLGRSGDSVLLGAISVPSSNRTGLFLIGPRMPSGNRRPSLQVRPLSRDVRTIPHQVCGLGPTL